MILLYEPETQENVYHTINNEQRFQSICISIMSSQDLRVCYSDHEKLKYKGPNQLEY